MKCEKCNEKQATFYYSCNINGEKSEMHLCADCARAEGFGQVFESPAVMFDRSLLNVFEDFFAPVGRTLPAFGSFGSGLGSIMAPAFARRSLRPTPAQTGEEKPESNIPDDAGEEIRARREREALKAQLHDAVQAEDYEKAIILRDKLREMDK